MTLIPISMTNWDYIIFTFVDLKNSHNLEVESYALFGRKF